MTIRIKFALACALFSATSCFAGAEEPAYSFAKAPFIHPAIIKDLSTWLSDNGDQVVAINLLDSVESNRYHGEIGVSGKKNPSVSYINKDDEDDEDEWFAYRLVGRLDNGVYVLRISDGYFMSLLLVTIEQDQGLLLDEKFQLVPKKRVLIKKFSEISLGYKYGGDVTTRGNTIYIQADLMPDGSPGLFPVDTTVRVQRGR